jgi:excisionase family DNA binding protein
MSTNPPTSRDRLLTLREVAELLQVRLRAVFEYLQRRELVGRRVRRRWRFRQVDVDAFRACPAWDFCPLSDQER